MADEDGEPFWITDPNALVGRRVTVLWSKGKRYKGVCTHYNPSDGKHSIVYDDGEQKRYTMTEKTFWVCDGTVEGIEYVARTAAGACKPRGGTVVWHDDPGLGCFARLL